MESYHAATRAKRAWTFSSEGMHVCTAAKGLMARATVGAPGKPMTLANQRMHLPLACANLGLADLPWRCYMCPRWYMAGKVLLVHIRASSLASTVPIGRVEHQRFLLLGGKRRQWQEGLPKCATNADFRAKSKGL